MVNLEDTYRRLSHPWTHEQLDACYRDARHRGAQTSNHIDTDLTRPIPLLAAAIPPSATASVAIHMVHALPSSPQTALPSSSTPPNGTPPERLIAVTLHSS